ncbi:MAG: hypothetical protein GY829_03455 [Gammaproteobacteria bacterium]|nr:hypothetical protein [Gammaproteobacteria bacterium]
MKIVFSRKGFDSTAGGYPSLIFPDGTLFSIPIPSTNDKYRYSDLDVHYEGDSIQTILNDLSGNHIRCNKWMPCNYVSNEQFCHYDPLPFSKPEFTGIALGQADSAEGHLRNQGIGKGDIFLFYGWFRKIGKRNGSWCYIENEPDVHLIWSYMDVGDVISLDSNEQQKLALLKYPFLSDHPHVGDQGHKKNGIYISDEYQYFPYHRKRCLTDMKSYKGRATWRLPQFFDQPESFSFLNNFKKEKDDVVISYRGYGQEFVLNLDNVQSNQEREEISSYIETILC